MRAPSQMHAPGYCVSTILVAPPHEHSPLVLSTVETAVCDIRNIFVTTGIGTSVERPFQRTTPRPEIRRAGGDVTNPTTRPPGSPRDKKREPSPAEERGSADRPQRRSVTTTTGARMRTPGITPPARPQLGPLARALPHHTGGRASLPRGGAQTRTGQTPPPANQMMNWLFKYYVTALPGGSAPPP